ncbi:MULTISPECIES: S1 family peptidase [Bacillus]|uniref:S1 family peptidase n=1 Tax=Bacillus TaxID=1386 RepID=UPI001C23EDB3|nr:MULTISPECIES: serine protease [Bacillus]MBU8888106.1 serine protease [Bacillus sp. FJAT-27001]WPF78425.1 serine protease [Bacillus velezensis]
MDLEKHKKNIVNIQCKFGFDIRTEGTALYARFGDEEYLITSRHLIFEDIGQPKKRFNSEIIKARRVNEQNTIATAVLCQEFGSPDYDIFIAGDDLEDVDLAVISLEHKQTEDFREALRKDGYTPFLLKENYESLVEGSDIFTVGFPDVPSSISRITPEFGVALEETTIVSRPVFSFGRIAAYDEVDAYFWGDISVSAGSSGGPVFDSNGSLIGIVQGQSKTYSTNAGIEIVTRGLFTSIVKAKYIVKLINAFKELKFCDS